MDDASQKEGNDLLRVAFGSCNKHEKSQDYWNNIYTYFNSENGPGYPDVWIWAGDIVYADTESFNHLERAYQKVKRSEYNTFVQGCKSSKCSIVGVWDDHDFGDNNLVGDLGPIKPEDSPFRDLTKPQRKAALVDFLGEPTRSKIGGRDQIYTAHNYKRDGVLIRVLLLDLRYDRQKPGENAKIMHDQQWGWLRDHLLDDDVDLHLIVSSTQVLRSDPKKDTWGLYPKQREKLLKLIGETRAQGVVLLTGDIHAAEISRLGEAEETNYGINFPLYEITSSGLNQTKCFLFLCFYNWKNPYQEGFVGKENFGEINIAKLKDGKLMLTAILRSTRSPKTGILLRKNIEYAPQQYLLVNLQK